MSSRGWFGFLAAVALTGAAGQAGCSCSSSETTAGGTGGTGGTGPTTSTGTGGGGAGPSTSSGGGGAGGAPGSCPGEAHVLNTGRILNLSGTTQGKPSDITLTSASCFGGADTSGPEMVYAVMFSGDATVTASVLGRNGFDPVLYTQSTCNDPESTIACRNQAGATDQEKVKFGAIRDQTIYFVVDTNGGTPGDFTMTIRADVPVCGDAVVNPGEECDDGGVTPGDGCDPLCKYEVVTDASESCPGTAVPIAIGTDVDLQGNDASTTGYADDYQTCMSTGGAPDRVYQFVPATDGTLHVSLRNMGASGGGFDGSIAAWQGTCSPTAAIAPQCDANDACTDPPSGSYMGCSDQTGGATAWDASSPDDPTTQEQLTFQVTTGTPVYVVVDGYADYSSGRYWLHADLSP